MMTTEEVRKVGGGGKVPSLLTIKERRLMGKGRGKIKITSQRFYKGYCDLMWI